MKTETRQFFCPRCGDTHEDGGLRCWVPFRSDEFWRGAAAAFGLMGMAEAIAEHPRTTSAVSRGDTDLQGPGPKE